MNERDSFQCFAGNRFLSYVKLQDGSSAFLPFPSNLPPPPPLHPPAPPALPLSLLVISPSSELYRRQRFIYIVARLLRDRKSPGNRIVKKRAGPFNIASTFLKCNCLILLSPTPPPTVRFRRIIRRGRLRISRDAQCVECRVWGWRRG